MVTLAAAIVFGGTRIAAAGGSGGRSSPRGSLSAIVAAGAPGVLVRTDDRGTTWSAAAGVADLETRRPVVGTGRFRVASLTKAMVATVVLQLVAEHRLGLDEPVDRWLPGILPDDDVTVRQLLRHTSGLADYLDDPEFADPETYTRRHYRPAQLVSYAVRRGPVNEPGKRFSYANSNYIVLGMLVERVTRRPLTAELARRVFAPAGMTDSYLPIRDRRIRGPHATGYYLPEGADPGAPGVLRPITDIDPSFAWGAYGVVSDARDVSRFFHALFGGRLLRSALLRAMHDGVGTPQAPIFPRYGLGLESVALTCGQFWGGTGSIPGYETMAFADADADGSRRIVVSVNVQRNDPDSGRMLLAILNTVNLYLCHEPYHVPESVTNTAHPRRTLIG